MVALTTRHGEVVRIEPIGPEAAYTSLRTADGVSNRADFGHSLTARWACFRS
jgi:hypothetical protein